MSFLLHYTQSMSDCQSAPHISWANRSRSAHIFRLSTSLVYDSRKVLIPCGYHWIFHRSLPLQSSLWQKAVKDFPSPSPTIFPPKTQKPLRYSWVYVRQHCAEIDEAARNRTKLIVRSLAEQNGVTEQLKAENQMEWVWQMNACKAQAEEVVKAELIYD